MRIIKDSLKYPAAFLLTLIFLTGLLVASACIPQSALKKNVQESAEFLCEGELFGCVLPGVESSKIDRYADSILLGIAYQYDENHPLTSVMWSSYYYTDYQNENKNLLDAVTGNLEANQQYLRYWHGSNAILRPLLLFLSLQQVYVLNGVVLAVLAVWLLLLLAKKKAWVPLVGMLVGLVLTSSWFVPLSLEYTWTYMLFLLMSIISLKFIFSNKGKYLGICFLLAGMLTNYMDFLTTETMTLLVPLLLVEWVKRNQYPDYRILQENGVHRETGWCSFRQELKNGGKWMLAWGMGYCGMWLMKWCMASVVLRQNVMPYVSEHIAERTAGKVGLKAGQYIIHTLGRNVKCLFPLEYGEAGIIGSLIFLAAAFYVGYVYHKKRICKTDILVYGGIGMVPFVRYLVLLNHSYLHYFFTYRALLATILAIVMIAGEVVEWRWLLRADVGKRKS